jgi:hypothetical protein
MYMYWAGVAQPPMQSSRAIHTLYLRAAMSDISLPTLSSTVFDPLGVLCPLLLAPPHLKKAGPRVTLMHTQHTHAQQPLVMMYSTVQ